MIFVCSSDLCCGSYEQVSTQALWYLCRHFFLTYSLACITESDFNFWMLVLHRNRTKQKFTNQNTVKFVNFLKIRLICNIFCCFWMFLNKHFAYITCAYLKKWNMLWCEIFIILFPCKDENINRFSNLHECTFKVYSAIMVKVIFEIKSNT